MLPASKAPRLLAILLACALSVGFFFRHQLGNGFTLLLGDRHDAVIALAILEHWWNVLRGLADPWRTPWFHPVAGTLGYNDGYLLFGLLYAVFRGLGADPFLSGELVNLATRVIGFLWMVGLCRRVLGLPFGWALLGAALFTISNGLFIRASHAQLLGVSFLPGLALLLHGALRALLPARDRPGRTRPGRESPARHCLDPRRPDRGRGGAGPGRRGALLLWGAGFVLGFAACLMTGFYMAWYAVFFGAATALAWLLVAGAAGRRALLGAVRARTPALAALLVLAMAANLPFLLLYLPKAAETGMHSWEMVAQHLPSPLDVVHVGERNLAWGWLVRLLNDTFRPGFPAWSERMTGLPPGLLLVFGAALAWLWRGADRADPARLALLRALGLATVATWVLTLQVGGLSAWRLVWEVVPGARAARVVARYQIFLVLPVLALAMAFLAARARRRMPWPLPGALCAFLLLEQVNLYAPLFLDRPHELARLQAVPPPPEGCRAFWVSTARAESRFGEAVEDEYNHNVEAMIVAAVRRLPTVNGISTFNPPRWPAGLPGQPGYEAAIRDWAAAHDLTGLCALDLQRMAWAPPGLP